MGNVYKPLMQVGGDYDGQFKPAVYDEDGKLKYQAFLAIHDLFYPEDECRYICTALQIAYDQGVEDTTHALVGFVDRYGHL